MRHVWRLVLGTALCLAPPLAAQSATDPPDLHDGLRVATAAARRVHTTRLVALERALATDSFPRTTSVLALQHGMLLYEGYFNGGRRELRNDTRSATKTLTGLAVGIAISKGSIPSADAPAFAYLRNLAPFRDDGRLKSAITVADFLTMSSALSCNDDDPNSPGNEENMYPLQRWARWAVDMPVKPGYVRDSAGRGPFSYCTAGVFLLGQILERATKTPADHYFDEQLFRPLGITEREWSRSPSGEWMTGGGLRLRSRDLAKIALMMLNGGRWRGRQVVPARWLERTMDVHRHASADADYGYLMWARAYTTACGKTSAWFMSGNGGNAVVLIKDLDAIVVVTRTLYNTRGMHQQTARIVQDYVLRALPCGR